MSSNRPLGGPTMSANVVALVAVAALVVAIIALVLQLVTG